jgi:hypothetical protein
MTAPPSAGIALNSSPTSRDGQDGGTPWGVIFLVGLIAVVVGTATWLWRRRTSAT